MYVRTYVPKTVGDDDDGKNRNRKDIIKYAANVFTFCAYLLLGSTV
jgi:hypothetical protein